MGVRERGDATCKMRKESGLLALAHATNLTHLLVRVIVVFAVCKGIRGLFSCKPLDVFWSADSASVIIVNFARVNNAPFTFASYSFGWRIKRAAASPFNGSLGFGYRSS